MIQNIAPHHYDNAYHPRPPKAGDRVFFYQDTTPLLSRATGLPFTWEEARRWPTFRAAAYLSVCD